MRESERLAVKVKVHIPTLLVFFRHFRRVLNIHIPEVLHLSEILRPNNREISREFQEFHCHTIFKLMILMRVLILVTVINVHSIGPSYRASSSHIFAGDCRLLNFFLNSFNK